MGRPCTYGSLDGEQGWLEGLVVQTLRVKMRRSYASQTRTKPHPRAHLAPTRLMWAMELVQMEGEIYFGI